jgi:heme/copper-type cytochrome/quinol oxidase subunit 1
MPVQGRSDEGVEREGSGAIEGNRQGRAPTIGVLTGIAFALPLTVWYLWPTGFPSALIGLAGASAMLLLPLCTRRWPLSTQRALWTSLIWFLGYPAAYAWGVSVFLAFLPALLGGLIGLRRERQYSRQERAVAPEVVI